MSTGQKHLVKCRCVLPQFKRLENPPAHKFIVFSAIQDNGDVVVKYAQCNNCGVIHRVTNICTSEIMPGKENSAAILQIEDIKNSINSNFSSILEANMADLPTWEAVKFIVENKKWGEFVVLSTETEGDEIIGKYIRILGENLCNVETFSRSTGIING